MINNMPIAVTQLSTSPRERFTDIAPHLAVACNLVSIKGVSIPSTLSAITSIEFTCTFTRHLNSFTQPRFRDWNRILLRFLGAVANFMCYLIHSLLAPFSTSRSKANFTNPVLGGFNPRRIRSTCLVSHVYYKTFVRVAALALLFLPTLHELGWGGKGGTR